MSVRQLTFVIAGEGQVDTDFLPKIVERVIEHCLRQHTQEAAVLPCLKANTRPSGTSFPEWMQLLQGDNLGTSLIFVHQDCDSRDGLDVRSNRWEQWLSAANEPLKWVLALPCRCVESWMLADMELLCSELRVRGDQAHYLAPQPQTDYITDPRFVLNEMLRVGAHRKPPRASVLRERLSQSARVDVLISRSDSFRQFVSDTCAAVAHCFASAVR